MQLSRKQIAACAEWATRFEEALRLIGEAPVDGELPRAIRDLITLPIERLKPLATILAALGKEKP